MVEFKILSWQDIDYLARQLFDLVKSDGYTPEIILGISRGGVIPARLLSDMFEARYLLEGHKTSSIFATMQVSFYASIAETHSKPVIAQDVGVDIFQKKILLIDDLADTGVSLICALDYLKLKNPKEVKIATLLYKPWSKVKPDYYVEETEEWVVFPHEYYEFMTERTLSQKLDKTKAWATFLELGIPDSAVIFFVENFF